MPPRKTTQGFARRQHLGRGTLTPCNQNDAMQTIGGRGPRSFGFGRFRPVASNVRIGHLDTSAPVCGGNRGPSRGANRRAGGGAESFTSNYLAVRSLRAPGPRADDLKKRRSNRAYGNDAGRLLGIFRRVPTFLRCFIGLNGHVHDSFRTRSMYSPVRVSIFSRSPMSTKAGAVISAPVSSCTGLFTLVAVSPRTPGSQ